MDSTFSPLGKNLLLLETNDNNSESSSLSASPLQLHLSSLASCDIPTLSGHLHHLWNENVFWSTLGSDCILALNPSESHQLVHSEVSLYSLALCRRYACSAAGRGAALNGELPVHIFGAASNAYWQAACTFQNQSIFCLGESGSGKSENCKLLLQQVVYSSRLHPAFQAKYSKKQFLNELNSATFLLECISNAGSLEVNFNASASPISCVSVAFAREEASSSLLLSGIHFESLFFNSERALCTSNGGGSKEVNFHIFYYLLAGLPEELIHSHGLTRNAANYSILGSAAASSDEEEASHLFSQMCIAMKNVGIGEKRQNELFAALGGLLHLGNVEFEPETGKVKGNSVEKTTARVKNHSVLVQAARLLCVTEEDLQICLLQTVEVVAGQSCSLCLDVHQAECKRNSIICTVYTALRQWIYQWINKRFNCCNASSSLGETVDGPVIRIVDTASPSKVGGENFCSFESWNSFCHAVAHEQTLGLWIQRMLKQPLEVLSKARIECKIEEYSDNAKVLSACEQTFAKFVKGKTTVSEGERKITISNHHNHHQEVELRFVDSPLFSSLAQGLVCVDLVDLLRESGNSLLRTIVNDQKIISCSDSRGQFKFCNNYQKAFERSKEIFEISNLDSVQFVLSLNAVHTSGEIGDGLESSSNGSSDAFNEDSLKEQLNYWQVDRVLGRKKAAFDVAMEESYFFSLFADVFHALELPLEANSFIPLFSELQIPLKMAKKVDNMIFLKFDAISLLEECFQDIPLMKPHAFLTGYEDDGHQEDEEFNDDETQPLAFQRQPSPTLSAGFSAALLSECNWAPPAKRTREKITGSRKRWLFFTHLLTWWIPDKMLVHFAGMEHPEVRTAWREKLALCMIILMISIFMIFNVVFLAKLICPTQRVFTWQEIRSFPANKPHVVVFGKVYDVSKLLKRGNARFLTDAAGTDISSEFIFEPRCNWSRAYPVKSCRGENCGRVANIKQFYVGDLGDARESVQNFATPKDARIIIRNRIYNITPITGANARRNINPRVMPPRVINIVTRGPYGFDRSDDFRYPASSRDLVCMEDFYCGVVDQRNSFRCKFAENLLLGSTFVIVAIMFIKFLSALRLPLRRDPEQVDKYVIMQVPCYTENEQSLRVTIDSLASLEYEDRKKLLFIVCDGMLIGSGNDRPTPRIVLDILGVPPSADPEPFSYFAIAEGSRALNQCKCYSGLYRLRDHTVPFVVLAKCGAPGETTRPGNRGKRDSQMILLNFLNHLYNDSPMSPLEIELARLITQVIGVDPKAYEFVLQVDADTEVYPDSLTMLVSALNNDSKIIGLCGETEVGNEKASLITMIQVYEYYISHHLAKAFESLFGTVTCLPGCFSIFRIRSVKEEIYLVADGILREYSDCSVNTLHKKNLLHLGEDRFLTTLLIKNFPYNKLCFIGDAKCKTIVPDSWKVLKSQRRRWINSTVHNLFELLMLEQLCGFCLFSMRFVVCIDLFATLVMPATVFYLGYLVVSSCLAQKLPIISLLMFAVAYLMQAVIFVIRGQVHHIGWMLLNILSMPIFNLYIPLYAFWHFDDFSWGNTRRIVGEDGKVKEHAVSEEVGCEEILASVPLQRLSDYSSKPWGLESSPVTQDPLAVAPLSRTQSLQGFQGGGDNTRRKSIQPSFAAAVARPTTPIDPLLSHSGFIMHQHQQESHGAVSFIESNCPSRSQGGSSSCPMMVMDPGTEAFVRQQIFALWRERLHMSQGVVEALRPGELKAAVIERLVRCGVAVNAEIIEMLEREVDFKFHEHRAGGGVFI